MVRARNFTSLLMVCTMAAAFGAPSPIYSNARYKFSLTPPAGWIAKSHPEAVAIFMEPEGEQTPVRLGSESNREFIERVNRKLKETAATGTTFRANLTITASKVLPGTTTEQYAKETRGRFEGLKMYRILGEKNMKVDGVPSILRTMRVNLAEGGSIRTREVIVVRGDTALSFALASSPEAFTRRAAEFDKTISTVKWK
jgi:hypothetical protein